MTKSLLIAAAALVISACGYHRKNEVYSQAATVTPHFSSIAAGIIQTQCYPCHSPSGGAPDFSTYDGVLRRVKAGDAGSSSFYTEVESGSMPEYRPQLSDDDILAIYQWIQNGAPND